MTPTEAAQVAIGAFQDFSNGKIVTKAGEDRDRILEGLIIDAINTVVADETLIEREKCAKTAENAHETVMFGKLIDQNTGRLIAGMIRARSTQP
jgi:hypothetical protein